MTLDHMCLGCRGILRRHPHAMECPRCGARWPVTDGVPVYASAPYFGEVGHEEMLKFVQAAEDGDWLTAAHVHFRSSNDEMFQYITDLNRASWIPLLPLGPESTILDVGAGFGAVTHALALAFAHVVAIEPVSERLRFLRARVEQEGLRNVEPVQTTVTELPFSDGTFDLIVLNGILEWVGEWVTGILPRVAQRSALRRLHRALKPGGILLIGIENRIGWGSLLGELDHSGLPFTNLMPRWLASLRVRLAAPRFYRTLLDPARGYRTYTYTRRGYTKLLREAGLHDLEFWWPSPSYNKPHRLLRTTDRSEVKAALRRETNYSQRLHGWAFRRTLKYWGLAKTGLIHALFPDFFIFAKNHHAGASPDLVPGSASSAIRDRLAARGPGGATGSDGLFVRNLKCLSLRNKQILTVGDKSARTVAIAKLANAQRPDHERIERGFRHLALVRRRLASLDPELGRSVPEPIDLFRVGNTIVALESPAAGVPLEDLVMQPAYLKDRRAVRTHLDLVLSWLTAFRRHGRIDGRREGIPLIPATWLRLDAEAPQAGAGVEDPSAYLWAQHGDFFPDNVFIDEPSKRITVIDWDDLGYGYPPLFDFFCLVTSFYYYPENISLPKGQTVERLSFHHTYFERNWFSHLVCDAAFAMCDALALRRADLPRYFAEYLAVRHHQFSKEPDRADAVSLAQLYRDFWDAASSGSRSLIFHA